MYKITGVDGKEYGPVSIDGLKRWAAEGRLNPQTRVQGPDSPQWKAISEFPELRSLVSGRGQPRTPPALPPTLPGGKPATGRRQGLAITSFVLGLVSLMGCLVVSGVPATSH
jgi:hypothetical protein